MTIRVALLCVVLAQTLTTPALSSVSVEFQQGANGYSGTEDTHLAIPLDFMGTGHRAAQFSSDPENPFFVWDQEDAVNLGHKPGESAILHPVPAKGAMGYGVLVCVLITLALFGSSRLRGSLRAR